MDAKWLTIEEKVHTIGMIRETHAGVANRHFKWHHLRELYADVKSWLFMFVAAFPAPVSSAKATIDEFCPPCSQQLPHVLQ